MKRRNILHTGIAAMLLLSVSACEDFKFGNDFLDKPITTDVTIDTVFSRKVYAEQALAEIYRSLPDFLPHRRKTILGDTRVYDRSRRHFQTRRYTRLSCRRRQCLLRRFSALPTGCTACRRWPYRRHGTHDGHTQSLYLSGEYRPCSGHDRP